MTDPRFAVDPGLRGQIDRATLRALGRMVRRAGRRFGLSRRQLANLGLRLVDDRTMKQIHQQHLGSAVVTDVLSFGSAAQIDHDGVFAGLGEPLADQIGTGDLVLDWQQVCRQAPGSTLAARIEEAGQLIVHGLAHLQGHDHGTRAEGRRMLRCERAGAKAANLSRPRRPYAEAR